MRWLLAASVVLTACVTTPTPKPVDPPQPKSERPVDASAELQRELQRTLEGFVASSESGEFGAVHAMLCKALRDRYTPSTLARDFGAEPYARERLALIKSKRTALFAVQGETASLEWAPGRSLRLVRESATWKIASLE